MFRLFVMWSCMDEASARQYETISRHFRNLEIEYETGMPVLPGWASVGNVAAQYGIDDADPFAMPATDQ